MKNRFEVSTQGMALLHDGRPLWQLVKELVANAWDEPDVQTCEVSIHQKERGFVTVTVSDDGGGFRDIEDAFTLFTPTPKQGNAEVRGRFNLGEKELISIARDAKVETVGHTVHFPASGGKTIRKNTRTTGTVITVTLNGRKPEVERTVSKLRSFLPPVEVAYIVNGQRIPNRRPTKQTTAKLPTILAEAPGQPVRRTERTTRVELYSPIDGERAQIYEMGIPIQRTDLHYDVNVMQKVPLPPNRNVVSPSYLKAIYAEVLAVTADELNEDTASESWVRLAVEDTDRTSDLTVQKVMKERFGDKPMILLPFDKGANERAYAQGHELVNSRSLSPIERERFKDNGLRTTQMFATHDPDGKPEEDVDPTWQMEEVGRYAQYLSEKLLGFRCNVKWVKGGNQYRACYGKVIRTLTFNVQNLGKRWFENCPSQAHTSLILHELAHEDGSEERAHGTAYIHTLSDLASKLYHTVDPSDWSQFYSEKGGKDEIRICM